VSEISIPGDKDDFLVAELECGGKMNRVVTTKSEIFGVPAGAPGQIRIDADGDQIGLQLLEGHQCSSVLALPQATLAARCRQSRASLRVGEDAGRSRIGTSPEFGSQLRAVLDDDELD
jgi:hypothetical protein